MMAFRSFLVGAVAVAGVMAMAAPSVTVDDVKTGEPWSTITVDYMLGGVDAELDYKIAFDVTANGVTKGVTNVAANLMDGADSKVIDTAALFGSALADPKAKVRVSLIAVEPRSGSEPGLGGVQLWENGPYWAECNVGATKPEEYGYYFWWGDTVGYTRNAENDGWVSSQTGASFSFSERNCPTYDKSNDTLWSQRYISANLLPKYDAAKAHLGAPWRMPTSDEMEELWYNCTTTWTTRNGVYGRLVTGKGAYASKSIFLPAAGYGEDDELVDADRHSWYWSSSPWSESSSWDSRYAWSLICSSLSFGPDFNCTRDLGFPVRPLRGKDVGSGTVETVVFSCTADFALSVPAAPSVTVGAVRTGEPWSTITVDYTLGGVDADLDYKVAFDVTANGVTKGVTNAVAKLADGADSKVIDTAALFGAASADPKAKVRVSLIAVKPMGGVQLWENGPYWAECNVGATKPEEYGYYFWWGDTVGYKRNASANGWVSSQTGASFLFTDSNCPTYNKSNSTLQSQGYIDSTGNLVAKYDAATAHLGAPWRMPTAAEFSALVSNCTTTWTTKNGVYGRLVTGKGAYASKSIFLPAAGYGDDSYLRFPGSSGYYWSSTPYSGYSNLVWSLYFSSGNFGRSYYGRDYGQSVRPLRGKDVGVASVETVVVSCEADFALSATLFTAFDGLGEVTRDASGAWHVTLTNDVVGTLELPGNLGAVTLDLNGHAVAEPPVRIVAAQEPGPATVLTIIDGEETNVVLATGGYFKRTLFELGFDVPTNGTAYAVTAYGLPAGLKLKYNVAVTRKQKVKGVTKTVVVTKAKSTWWIEGVPTATLNSATQPVYLTITVDGVATTVPLALDVIAQEVTDLGELPMGVKMNVQYWLPGVKSAVWAVSGLPSGLKYTAKLVTTRTTKTVNKKKVAVVTTNALPYSVYGTPAKAGLYTITAKRKTSGCYETLKYRVLVTPKAVDAALFGEALTNRISMAYVPETWLLTNDVSQVGGKVAKVTGLPTGLSFAAADVYAYANAKKKTGKYLKQAAQTIVGTPTKTGTFVVTFTKNVKSGKKTVVRTAQILWRVVANETGPELHFNEDGGVIASGTVGMGYTNLLAFAAGDAGTVTASGLPAGIKLVKLSDGRWGFKGYTTKAGTYYVTVKATLNGRSVSQRLALKVTGLPAWAKGTFTGFALGRDEEGNIVTNGLATVSVTSAGKISGKFADRGTNWTFSASSYTSQDEDGRTCGVAVKAGYTWSEKVKKGSKTVTVKHTLTRPFRLTVGAGAYMGELLAEETPDEEGAPVIRLEAWQSLWGGAYKALGKALFYNAKKKLSYQIFTVGAPGLAEGDTLTLKITTAGSVTATLRHPTGKFQTVDKKKQEIVYVSTCKTVLVPTCASDVEAAAFTGEIGLFFAPSAAENFGGYAATLALPFGD